MYRNTAPPESLPLLATACFQPAGGRGWLAHGGSEAQASGVQTLLHGFSGAVSIHAPAVALVLVGGDGGGVAIASVHLCVPACVGCSRFSASVVDPVRASCLVASVSHPAASYHISHRRPKLPRCPVYTSPAREPARQHCCTCVSACPHHRQIHIAAMSM